MIASRGCVAGLALGAGVQLGGCSLQLGAFDKADLSSDVTGSITPVSLNAQASLPSASDGPTEADLAYARAAASEVLARGGKGVSQPWENPSTGARGAVTPLASAYTTAGLTCHDFLASYVREQTQTWLQGDACKINTGKWEVRGLKAWKKS